jgi:hypothetical protein
MSLRRLSVAFAGSLIAASLIVVGPAPAEPKVDCPWGAASVTAVKVNGQYVQSEPATSGCIPTSP